MRWATLTKSERILAVLGGALIVRLAAMAIVPLTDTTEARYGEIARLMLETGDWVTPYFDYGVPFWGKPPLAFWLEAGSYKLFGVNEFAGRLPSLLATLASMAVLYRFACEVWSRLIGLWTLVIFATSAVVYVNAGAILTDPFLMLGTTLAMISPVMALRRPRSPWGYLFFIGLAIGLLAKGPVAVVLIAGPLGMWVALKTQWLAIWRALPWVRGLALTAIIVLPWYGLAEARTPGFLEYFIIGEHWKRFVEPGWSGDLYGAAHRRTLGTIWLYWLGAAFPWGVLALWRMLAAAVSRAGRSALVAAAANTHTLYLLSWAIFPMVFFTFARNILWTYVLPAMPAFAVLLAVAMARNAAAIDKTMRLLTRGAWVAPTLLAAFVAVAQIDPSLIKTEKYLVQAYAEGRRTTAPLVYIRERPFSARFYTRGQAKLSSAEDLAAAFAAGSGGGEFVAVPNNLRSELEDDLSPTPERRFTSRDFTLYGVAKPPGSSAVPAPTDPN